MNFRLSLCWIVLFIVFALHSQASIVINEIMYYPSSLNDDDEYIELYNSGDTDIDLSNWQIDEGIRFTFPTGTRIPSAGYLVVAASPDAILKRSPGILIAGPFKGKLSNDGETINLYNGAKVTVDSVLYWDERGWPIEADGFGPSIERIHPDMSSHRPESWAKGPDGGTPGKVNSSVVTGPIPIIFTVNQSPVSPSSTDTVNLLCQIDHPLLIQETNVWFKLESENDFQSSEMFDDGRHNDGSSNDGLWGGEIPAKPNGSIVEFYLEAMDENSQKGFFPREGKNRPTLYRVDNSVYQTSLPLYRIAMRDGDERLLRSRSANSNEELDASFIYDNSIYYNTGVRFRGKGSRGQEPKSYRVNFSLTKYFDSIRKLNLNAINVHRQFVGMEVFKALGMQAPEAQLVSLAFNKTFVPNYIQMERTDKDMMGRLFGDESGNLYRGIEQANLDYRGEEFGAYIPNYDKISNEKEADYSDIVRLCDAFSRSSEDEFVSAIGKQINIHQWIRWFAIKKIMNDQEGGLSKERGDDYYIYHNPDDNLFYLLPWDLDSIFTRPFLGLFEYGTPSVRRLLQHPDLARFYYAELVKILEEELPQSQVDSIIDQTSAVTNQSTRDDMKNVSRDLRNFISSSIPRSLSVEVSQETGVVLIPDGDSWKYFRGNKALPVDWNQNHFDDSSWQEGPSGFGYGDNDDRTVLNDMQNQYTTVFIRKTFPIDDPQNYTRLILQVLYDDGFIAYLNGKEIVRSNFEGTPNYKSLAVANHEASAFETFAVENVSSILIPGHNVLALVGANVTNNSSDFSLAVQVDAAVKNENHIELKGYANAIKTRWVTINDEPVSFVPWMAQWSYPTILKNGTNAFHIEALNSSHEIIEATDVIIPWGTEPSDNDLEVNGDEVWSTDRSPIFVDRNIIIPPTGSLTIEPGVTFQMAPAASIIVYGTLVVNGEADRLVRFIPQNPDGKWGVIAIEKSVGTVKIHHAEFTKTSPIDFQGKRYPAAVSISGSTVEIEDCLFHDIDLVEGVGAGIEAHDSFITVRGNRFSTMGEMLHCNSCQSIVENNRFENVIGYSDAIDFDGDRGTGSVIRGNVISGSEDDGIDLGFSSPRMECNWIEHCADKGISLEGNSTPSVMNSVITQCAIGIAIKDECQAKIIHNTIVSCKTGIGIYEKNPNQGGGIGEIINCIIWDSEQSLQVDGISKATLTHSDLMQLPENLAQTNFSIHPKFKDLLNWNLSLQASSPLIDQGLPTDIQVDFSGQQRSMGSAPDIGAFESQGITNIRTWFLY